MSFSASIIRSAIFGLAVAAFAGSAGAQQSQLGAAKGGAIRALVIGIDAYQYVPVLKGAVADAHDLETTLRRNGVSDVTALLDAASDRATVMRALEGLVGRSRAGDLVILTIAGHGVQEPERVKGSQPDGMDNVFILAGFNAATAAGSQQRILGSEFNHVIKQLEAKGAQVMFVADACHGGGLTRQIDPRASAMSYRQVPRYTLAADTLKPISNDRDTDGEFKQTAVLAAVDRNTKAPEVRVPGVAGLRGALSYAVARAFEGAADENHDGQVTESEMFAYVRQVAYQLSDQRQIVATAAPSGRSADDDALFSRTRAVVLLDAPARSEPRPEAPATASPASPAPRPSVPVSLPTTATPLAVVRVAVLGNDRDALKSLEAREARFEAVATNENPDLVWDPTTRDVLAGADVIARNIDRGDLPGVIDRAAAVNGFKRLAAKAPQSVRVLPDDKLYRNESRIEIQVSGVAKRSLLLFNIAGDGTVQSLYPIGSDPPVIATPDYKFPVAVGAPFGADQVVAITSSQRLIDLEQALKRMNQRRAAAEVYKLVERYAPPDAKIGATNFYTSP